MTESAPQGFDEWAILELMGRRVLAGRLTEHEIAGTRFIRLDVPDGPTKFFAPAAVYAITPADEATAREVARSMGDGAPVERWQLALPGRSEYAEESPF